MFVKLIIKFFWRTHQFWVYRFARVDIQTCKLYPSLAPCPSFLCGCWYHFRTLVCCSWSVYQGRTRSLILYLRSENGRWGTLIYQCLTCEIYSKIKFHCFVAVCHFVMISIDLFETAHFGRSMRGRNCNPVATLTHTAVVFNYETYCVVTITRNLMFPNCYIYLPDRPILQHY